MYGVLLVESVGCLDSEGVLRFYSALSLSFYVHATLGSGVVKRTSSLATHTPAHTLSLQPRANQSPGMQHRLTCRCESAVLPGRRLAGEVQVAASIVEPPKAESLPGLAAKRSPHRPAMKDRRFSSDMSSDTLDVRMLKGRLLA